MPSRAQASATIGAEPWIREIRHRHAMAMRSDEPELRSLMLAGLEGDALAHRKLLIRLSAILRGYFKAQFVRMGKDAADAEDLVQETLLSVHTHRHTYDRLQLLTPWVYAIARYRLVDFLRRTKCSLADVPLEEAQDVSAPDDQSVDSSLDLGKLLVQLTPKTRQAIQLMKLDGLSASEAASRSGMSPSAIKVAVHRGLKVLSRLVATQKSP